ncbi:hypothetical protein BH10CYA1_BH10CYA1_61300 [soil metagenome]
MMQRTKASAIAAMILFFGVAAPSPSAESKWPYPTHPTLTPGPWPNAFGMSGPIILSMTRNLAVTLKIIKSPEEFNPKTYDEVTAKVHERLREIFADRTVECRVLLKPNGQISDLTIWKSSAPHDLDIKACELIRKSAPFQKNEYPDALRYAISFPNYNPYLVYWNEQVDIKSAPYRVDETP